jgi:environmental stress-induced protein Ves
MKHRSPADYRAMPWANGRGHTSELLREDGPQGLLLRLSAATVTEDGEFSVFPGIERNLTVISGPGFRLEGQGLSLQAAPRVPVAFPGDVALRATGVTAPSEDFNVMTARALPRPRVWLAGPGRIPAGGRLFLFALDLASVNAIAIAPRDLIETHEATTVDWGGPLLAVRLP